MTELKIAWKSMLSHHAYYMMQHFFLNFKLQGQSWGVSKRTGRKEHIYSDKSKCQLEFSLRVSLTPPAVSCTLLNSSSKHTSSLILQSLFLSIHFTCVLFLIRGPLLGFCVFVGPPHEAAGLCLAVRGREGVKERDNSVDWDAHICRGGRAFSGLNLH